MNYKLFFLESYSVYFEDNSWMCYNYFYKRPHIGLFLNDQNKKLFQPKEADFKYIKEEYQRQKGNL